MFVKDQQVFHFFADSDELDRDLELVGDRQYYPTLGRTVQLGNRQGRDMRRSGELAGLFDGILAGGSVEHQQDFVWGIGHHLLDYPVDLAQFLHQIGFVVEAACRIDDDDIGVPGNAALDGVEGYGAGVGAHSLFDDRHPNPITPDAELVNGGGTEGIGCAKEDGITSLLEVIGEFANGGCFADAVDADDENDIWF